MEEILYHLSIQKKSVDTNPREKERVRAMKDALSAVRQFTSEGNLSRNGKLNTTTMKEMWDYES